MGVRIVTYLHPGGAFMIRANSGACVRHMHETFGNVIPISRTQVTLGSYRTYSLGTTSARCRKKGRTHIDIGAGFAAALSNRC